MASLFDIKGQIVLVTGASMGLGRGIAKSVAGAGAKTIVAARSMDKLEELTEQIRAEGGESFPLYLDVTDIPATRLVFEKIEKDYGRLDILVNAAGLGFGHKALDVTENDWDEMMSVNLKGLFFCSQAAGKIMTKNHYGRIINISSQASVVALRGSSVYCATKGGVNMVSKVMALEWAQEGVTVNCIGPTYVYTPGTAESLDNPEFLKTVVDRIPVKRVATIDDVAGAVIYLASPAAGMVTGTLLLVDGGWTAQ